MNVAISVIVGVVAGLAARFLSKPESSFGLVGDLIAGVVGACLAGMVISAIGWRAPFAEAGAAGLALAGAAGGLLALRALHRFMVAPTSPPKARGGRRR